jgi:hypothetical protein
MVWFCFIVSCLWGATAGAVWYWGGQIRKTSQTFRAVLTENTLLQQQITDLIERYQPHLCPLPSAERADPADGFTHGKGSRWVCPQCRTVWRVRGTDTLNAGVNRIDWVTDYEMATGHRPIFDRRPAAGDRVKPVAPISPRHRAPRTLPTPKIGQ